MLRQLLRQHSHKIYRNDFEYELIELGIQYNGSRSSRSRTFTHSFEEQYERRKCAHDSMVH